MKHHLTFLSRRMQSLLTFGLALASCLRIAQSLEVTNVVICSPPYVNSEDINVIKVHRISSPYYDVGNTFHSEGDPFNLNVTRVFWHEVGSSALEAPAPARGLVWGKIKDLISWTTFEEYRKAALPILPSYNPKDTPEYSFHWSRIPGEENIMYFIRKSKKMVIRLNVDTGLEEDLISYDPGDGKDISPRLCGWTTDGKLMLVYQESMKTDPWCGGGIEIDPIGKTKVTFAKFAYVPPEENSKHPASSNDIPQGFTRSVEWQRVQGHNLSSGHGNQSPSGRFTTYEYSNFGKQGVVDTKEGRYYFDNTKLGGDEKNRLSPYCSNYITWNASENWFVLCSSGQYCDPDHQSPFPLKPEVQNFGIWQVHFLGAKPENSNIYPFAYRKLLEVKSSSGWVKDQSKSIMEKGNLMYMEGCRIHPNVSRNGRWIYFLANNGNYNQVDRSQGLIHPEFAYATNSWSSCGVFLAECESAAKVSESATSNKP